MKKGKKTVQKKGKPDVGVWLSMALTLFCLSFFLLYSRTYFGSVTVAANWILIAVGIMILGISLSVVDQITVYKEATYDKFGFIGMGIGILIICFLIYQSANTIWLNILLFPFLVFGLYAINMGIINVIRSKMEVTKSSNSTQKAKGTNSLSIKLINGFAWIVGLIASLLQILQFLKVIP